MTLRRVLKLLGLAGVAGVATGGVLIARGERQRRAVTPAEVRDRLRSRAGGRREAEPGVASPP